MVVYWCGISSIHYANKANINFGIISCCFIVSVVVNTAAGLVFFGEKLTLKTSLGIIVTMCGIIWVSLAKGSEAMHLKQTVIGGEDFDENEVVANKSKAIVLALLVGVGNALQTIQSKFMIRWVKYPVVSITADIGLAFAIIAATLALIFYLAGSPAINLYNMKLIFVSSILGMLCWLVGQNACVRGLAGPALCIIYSNCFFTTLL